ncbi:pentapeptide repeat-containing protein [Nonomuraea sp. NEAU-A123]|uniref:pentapeptide repeat-containing protein n=1 Tax=Nonomuraea sp. NEAU-A123 TaxID=2839649 RepID=UPI001BE42E63|nr:pentapeptide repeat-containing protein [Nonomuraea sp. NEAU-A123]MBT2234680.1 pentapeptide repeat-containing protein [Nonomuraea sp. NEAU-A123]
MTVAELPFVFALVFIGTAFTSATLQTVAKVWPRPANIPPLSAADIDQLTPKERMDAINSTHASRIQALSTFGVMLGVAFTVGGLIYTAGTLEATQQGQITDRYTKAVEQLGSQARDVRLGAIYALERIARDSERDHETVLAVLAAYAREHGDEKGYSKASKDVVAALTVIGRNPPEKWTIGWLDLSEVQAPSVRLTGLDLQFVDLVSANLSRTTLTDGNFRNARLIRANLSAANLSDSVGDAYVVKPIGNRPASFVQADLQGADLERAMCAGVDFSGADMRSINAKNSGMYSSNLSGADLRKANMSGASLGDADMRDSMLSYADFHGAKMQGADFRGAQIDNIDLRGADLRKAKGLPSIDQIKKLGGKVDEDTKF